MAPFLTEFHSFQWTRADAGRAFVVIYSDIGHSKDISRGAFGSQELTVNFGVIGSIQKWQRPIQSD